MPYHVTKSRVPACALYFYCSGCSTALPKANWQDWPLSFSCFMINLRLASSFRAFIFTLTFLSFKVCDKKLDLPRVLCMAICVWGKLFVGVRIQFHLILVWVCLVCVLGSTLESALVLKQFLSLKTGLLSCIYSYAYIWVNYHTAHGLSARVCNLPLETANRLNPWDPKLFEVLPHRWGSSYWKN